MLLEKIEALRKEPKAKRNRYAFGVALSFTMVIAIVWGVSLPARLQIDSPIVESDDEETVDFLGQFAEIRNYVGDSLGEIQAQAELISASSTAPQETAASSSAETLSASSSGQSSSTTKPLNP